MILTMKKRIAEICTIRAPAASLKVEVGTPRGVEMTLEVLVAGLSIDVGNKMRESTDWKAKLVDSRGESKENVVWSVEEMGPSSLSS